MAKFEMVDLDDGPDLPSEHPRMAAWLFQRGWAFEEGCWPATRTLTTRTSAPRFSDGADLTLCFEPFSWLLGAEWPSDLDAAYGERWRDVLVHLGPFTIAWHRWWLGAQHR